MAQEQQLDLSIDSQNLYREEVYTDLKMGSIRIMIPVKPDRSDDPSRTPMFFGSTQLMTPQGPLPIQSRLPANNFEEALSVYVDSMKKALDQVMAELEQMAKAEKEKQDSRIIVPGT